MNTETRNEHEILYCENYDLLVFEQFCGGKYV